jgi:GTP cyclohydrolase IB
MTAILPDIASTPGQSYAPIQWVGMENIACMIRAGNLLLPASAHAKVDLIAPAARGIHMSRLYLALESTLEASELNPALLASITQQFLDSHAGLSRAALIELQFALPIKRAALQSELSGWRHYPIHLRAERVGGDVSIELGLTIQYASTCPCSAALARELIAGAFEAQFAGQKALSVTEVSDWLKRAEGASFATPHAQRSELQVRLKIAATTAQFALLELIEALEACLQTPVQTAVKRVDEQAFARRNGANLMFVEDAVRKVHALLAAWPGQRGFRAKVAHLESLHAHDAVAEIAG